MNRLHNQGIEHLFELIGKPHVIVKEANRSYLIEVLKKDINTFSTPTIIYKIENYLEEIGLKNIIYQLFPNTPFKNK